MASIFPYWLIFIRFSVLTAAKIAGGGANYYSQCGQDWFVNFLFNDKSDGFFIDIGANDPIKINNTYFFEQKGWSGLAFEPLQKYQKKWEQERKTKCLPIALGNENREVKFREMDQDYLSGVNGVDNTEEIEKLIENRKIKIVSETTVKQRMLKDILEENHIKEVDFISLDVEGCELQILQGINFHKVKIKCLVIENVDNLEMMYKIRKYLTDRGYWLIARLTSDDVFVHRKYFYKK